MKLNTLGIVVMVGGLSSFALADADHVQHDGPCKKIEAACQAAGFKKGAHDTKKGLFLDCVDPILKGQTIAGVTVVPLDVKACQALHKEHKK